VNMEFWHDLWAANEIAFHQSKVTPALRAHLDKLGVEPGGRLFLPLCGKTLDIGWLRSQGYAVAGAELSEIAVRQLFAELDVTPQVTPLGKLKHYGAPGLDIFVGDIFELTREMLGEVAAVHDRAAIVALPPEVRERYTGHLVALTRGAPQLVVTFEYDQQQMDGPPFSVPDGEIRAHYGDVYTVERLERLDLPGGMRGKIDAKRSVFLLRGLPSGD